MGGPEMQERMRQFEMFRGYMQMVDQYARIAHDPATAGIASVIRVADMLKARGPQPAIDYFEKLLPDVKNPAVQTAIHLQLGELYKATGAQDKALEHLRILMTTADTSAPAQPGPSGPPPGR
jgi:lipopolysaccharide biosynthesis regulator YciM